MNRALSDLAAKLSALSPGERRALLAMLQDDEGADNAEGGQG